MKKRVWYCPRLEDFWGLGSLINDVTVKGYLMILWRHIQQYSSTPAKKRHHGGEEVANIVQNCVTSFVDDPFTDLSRCLHTKMECYNLAFAFYNQFLFIEILLFFCFYFNLVKVEICESSTILSTIRFVARKFLFAFIVCNFFNFKQKN